MNRFGAAVAALAVLTVSGCGGGGGKVATHAVSPTTSPSTSAAPAIDRTAVDGVLVDSLRGMRAMVKFGHDRTYGEAVGDVNLASTNFSLGGTTLSNGIRGVPAAVADPARRSLFAIGAGLTTSADCVSKQEYSLHPKIAACLRKVDRNAVGSRLARSLFALAPYGHGDTAAFVRRVLRIFGVLRRTTVSA